MKAFTVDLSNAHSFDSVVAAFNDGFFGSVSAHWYGRSWDAFHDCLWCFGEQEYQLTLVGWTTCSGLSTKARQRLDEIFSQTVHIKVIYD